MNQSNLKNKATTGILWAAMQKYSSMIIQFIAGIILARLLTPYDYGCIGMLTIFVIIAECFIEGGLGTALIQKKRPTQEDYSTIFFWNLGMAFIFYAILFFTAPLIAQFYKTPILCNVLRVQGIVLFIYAFNLVQRNQLQKQLNFKVLSIATVTTSLVSLGITIYMAYSGYGVWALVAQNISTAVIQAIFFWLFIKWRPTLHFSWKSFRELFSFGFYMLLTDILNTLGKQIQALLIGRVYNPSIMGIYSKAASTEHLASSSISQIMQQVTFPLYSEVQDDLKRLSNIVRQLGMAVSYITFPLLFILMLCAKPIFVFLYSDRWIDCVPYFQVLCFSGLAYCMQSVNHQSISAIGKSRLLFIWTFVKRVVGIMFVIGGLMIAGMKGLLVGMVLNTWFSYAVNIALVSKYVGYKWWKQLYDIMPVMIVSFGAMVISYYVVSFFHIGLYLDGILKGILYIVIYIGWTIIFRPEASLNIETIIQSIINKK